MGVQKRRKYSREFKVEAVRKVLVDDRTPTHVAEEMGITPKLLCTWIQGFREDEVEAFPGKGRRNSKDQEIFELKREVEQLREEKDILKKALAVFSRPQR
jgi:transposase